MAEHETIGGAGQQPAPAEAASPPDEAVVTEEAVAEEDAPVAQEAPSAQEAPAADEPGADHEAVARDLEELAARAEKADEYLELAQRTKADFENYRRRAVREAAAAQDRGVAKLAKELLPAVDNLDRALAAAETAGEADNGTATLVSGIKLVHADVLAALGRAGIEAFSPQGEPFDPQHHEAVAQQAVDGAQPGTVIEVYQRGYRLGDSILRPARVVVAG
jgi:molecular chaperone GrpE